MATLLLTDPVLCFLEPADRHHLRSLNREHRDAIDAHTATKATYTVRMHSTLPWRSRQALYALYPNVEALTFECGGPDVLPHFLRPCIKSLHLLVPLHLSMYPEEERFQWDFMAEEVVCTFESILGFLRDTPDAQLDSLKITFHPTVRLTFMDDHEFVVNYDRDGPIYESADTTIEDSYGSPEIYFSIIETTPMLDWLAETLQAVAEKKQWKTFSLPAEFPGASTIPFATLSKPCLKDEESLWNHIHTLRSMKN